MDLGELIKSWRTARGWSQQQLAQKVGAKRTTISMLELGKHKLPRQDLLMRIAQKLEKDPNELYEAVGYVKDKHTEYHAERSPEAALSDIQIAIKAYIPVYTKVSAGDGIDAIDYVAVTRSRPAPENMRAYRVKGLCLEPEILEGDTVVVDPERRPENGNLVICTIGDQAHVKRVRITKDNQISLRNNYGEYTPDDGCHIQGVVVDVIRRMV